MPRRRRWRWLPTATPRRGRPSSACPAPPRRAALDMAVDGFRPLGKATPHDVVVCAALAERAHRRRRRHHRDRRPRTSCWRWSAPQFHEAGPHTPATIARIEHMLETGKPSDGTEVNRMMPDLQSAPARHALRPERARSAATGFRPAGLRGLTPDLIDAVLEEAAKSARTCCCRSTAPATRRAATGERRGAHARRASSEAYAHVPRGRLDRRRRRSGVRRPGPAARRRLRCSRRCSAPPTWPSACIPA